jgi:hypothetical protein
MNFRMFVPPEAITIDKKSGCTTKCLLESPAHAVSVNDTLGL